MQHDRLSAAIKTATEVRRPETVRPLGTEMAKVAGALTTLEQALRSDMRSGITPQEILDVPAR